MNRSLVIIAHNLRSCHNVGSLLRTAEGLGVETVFLTGHTPFPAVQDDKRMPHIVRKQDSQISKTALGAELSQAWQQSDQINPVIKDLKTKGFVIAALEQTDSSVLLPKYDVPAKFAIILGREVEGIEPEVLKLSDVCLEIPMFGSKESFNVVQAAAMALFKARFA